MKPSYPPGSEQAAASSRRPRLARKPGYPPGSAGERVAQRLVEQNPHMLCRDTRSSSEDARPSLCCECSCDDIEAFALRLLALEREQRLLVRSVSTLESVVRELLQGLQTSDDIALLERLACSAMVYNEELTSKRELRFLRSSLRKIISRFV
jgi:hypothetical protein